MLTTLEKNVLDEMIADIKSINPILRAKDSSHQLYYDFTFGEWASFKLFKTNIDYVLANGNFSESELLKVRDFVSKMFGKKRKGKSIEDVDRDKIASDEQDSLLMDNGLTIEFIG